MPGLTCTAVVVCANDAGYLMFIAQTALALRRINDFRETCGTIANRFSNQMPDHWCRTLIAAIGSEWIAAERETRAAGQSGFRRRRSSSFSHPASGCAQTFVAASSAAASFSVHGWPACSCCSPAAKPFRLSP
jgi:hypothetical protein